MPRLSSRATDALRRSGRGRICRIPGCRPSPSAEFRPLGSTTNLPQEHHDTTEIFDNVSWAAPFGQSKHSSAWLPHPPGTGAPLSRQQRARIVHFLSWADFAAGQVNTSTFKQHTLAYWDRFPGTFTAGSVQGQGQPDAEYGIRYEYPSNVYQTGRTRPTSFWRGSGAARNEPVLTIDPSRVDWLARSCAGAGYSGTSGVSRG